MLSRKNWVLSRTGGALSRTARSVEIVSLCLQLRHAAMDRGEGGETDREIQYQIQERGREEKRGEWRNDRSPNEEENGRDRDGIAVVIPPRIHTVKTCTLTCKIMMLKVQFSSSFPTKEYYAKVPVVR